MRINHSIEQEEWNRATDNLPGLSLMQTWEYAEAKARSESWVPVRAAVMDGSNAIAWFQGIVRGLPLFGGGLFWVNRGPLRADDRVAFEDVLEVMARWAAQRRWYVRVAPPLPGVDPEQLRIAGFQQTAAAGWASSVVDLTLPEERLLAGLEQKWRNCLNKSVRSGIRVEIDSDASGFRGYLETLRQQLRTKPFPTSVTPDFLDALQAALPAGRKAMLLVAKHDGEIVGSYVIVRYGQTAEYISSVVNEAGRRLNAGQALLWQAMIEMQRRGCRRFDVGGMDPDRTPPGIYHFKQGVGGSAYRLANEIESAREDWRSALIRWRIGRSRGEKTQAAGA